MAFRKQLATRAKVFVDRDGDGEVRRGARGLAHTHRQRNHCTRTLRICCPTAHVHTCAHVSFSLCVARVHCADHTLLCVVSGQVEAHEIAIQALENATLRVQAFLAAVAAESIVGTALRLVLLMIPWPFYIAIFQVCWNCYVRGTIYPAAAAPASAHTRRVFRTLLHMCMRGIQ